MKQWRLRKAANKLAHYEPRGHHGSSATVPLNGSPHMVAGHPAHKFDCQISPSGSRRLESEGSRGSRGSDSEFNAVAAPGSDGCSREPKPSKWNFLSGVDRDVSKESSSLFGISILVTQETRLRDICTAKRREMETMLNVRRDHHDWKALARDLGKSSASKDKIDNAS